MFLHHPFMCCFVAFCTKSSVLIKFSSSCFRLKDEHRCSTKQHFLLFVVESSEQLQLLPTFSIITSKLFFITNPHKTLRMISLIFYIVAMGG